MAAFKLDGCKFIFDDARLADLKGDEIGVIALCSIATSLKRIADNSDKSLEAVQLGPRSMGLNADDLHALKR